MNKLRGFVIDESTGGPLPRVPLGIVDISADSGTAERTLAIVQSDHNGFFSVPIKAMSRLEGLTLYPLFDPTRRIKLADFIQGPDGGAIIPIPLKTKPPSGSKGWKGFPSIVEPDTTDWLISPGSFANKEPLRLGQEGCEELVISRAVTRTFRFSQIVREPAEAPNTLAPASHVQRSCEGPPQKPLCWRRGALLLYETTWAPMGHALGEVAYSLALAPCEKVNLAVIEWSRQDSLTRGEDTSLAEQLQHNLRRDRSIEETVDAVLSESQRGSSVGGGLGVNLGVANVSLAGSYAGTSGTRKVASDAVQEISDRIVQASTLAQRFNSTVIVQGAQAERDAVQTRTVANNNHCHALTVLYYQVLRHFLVETRLADKQDVILITRPVHDFGTHAEVLRYRLVLQRVLLDASLRRCFDALEKEFCAKVKLDKRGFVEEPEDHELKDIQAKIRTGEHGINHPWTFVELKLLVKSGPPVPLNVVDHLVREPPTEPMPSWIMGVRTSHVPETAVLAAHQEDILTLRPARRIDWGEVTAVEISHDTLGSGPDHKYDLAALRLDTASQGDHWVMHNAEVNFTLSDGGKASRPVLPFGPQKPEDVLTDGELCCVERLVTHLRDNALYYSRAIWLAEDRDARAMWLNLYDFELAGQSGRLLDFVRNEIVGVVGDYIALPLASQEFSGTLDTPAPEQRIVSLPTRGLFAEAKLGSCNACEELDVTRFWDWTESPCPDNAPMIEGIHPGSRAQANSAAPTVTSPTLGIEAPPAAPEPASIAGVLDALGKSDVFKDMSGKEGTAGIVEQLVKGAIDLEKEKLRQQPAAAAVSGGGPSTGSASAGSVGGGGTVKPPSEGRVMHDKLKAIEAAEKRGDISPETAERASEDVVMGSTGTSSDEYIVPWDWRLTYADTQPPRRWMGAVAAMLSWRDKQTADGTPYSLKQAMQLLDATRPNNPIFENKLQNSLPLQVLPAAGGQPAVDELAELFQATKTTSTARMLRRSAETFNALSAAFVVPNPPQVRKLLEQYGPLCLADIGADVTKDGENINGFVGTVWIIAGVMGDNTEAGTKVQVFDVPTNQMVITGFNSVLSLIAKVSATTARDGEVFFLHFE